MLSMKFSIEIGQISELQKPKISLSARFEYGSFFLNENTKTHRQIPHIKSIYLMLFKIWNLFTDNG